MILSERSAANLHKLSLNMTTEKMKCDKKYRASKLDEISSFICGLLNSGGGSLEIVYSDQNKDDKCLRMIEQRLIDMIGLTNKDELLKIKAGDEEIVINATQSSTLVTLNYNLCLPAVTQVNEIPSTDSVKNIRKILTRRFVEDCVVIRSHVKLFQKDTKCELKENINVQFKSLKSDSSKPTDEGLQSISPAEKKNKSNLSKSKTGQRVKNPEKACTLGMTSSTSKNKGTTLADRIVGQNNKFTHYVSGFANRQGGHIYYGISDNGTVEGQLVDKQQEIRKKVEKTINKTMWPIGKPKQGEQWEIFFENVVGNNKQPIPNTFVIVIYIAACPGGVFIDEPESYYIDKNATPQAQRFTFVEWRSRFLSKTLCPVVTHVARVEWSSPENKTIFCNLSEKLVDLRDAGDYDAFKRLCNMAIKNFSLNNAEQIVKAGQVTIAYKSNHFMEAKMLLNEFEELFKTSKDSSIFKARFLLSKCLVERSEGNYEESYKTSKEAVQVVLNIPVGLCPLWVYLEAAMSAIRVAMNNDNMGKYVSLRQEALHYLEEASAVAWVLKESEIPFRIDDFQHKLCIYKAWVLLNCSVTGDVAKHIKPDIELAVKQLAMVDRNQLGGKPLTPFRETEYYLARSDLFRQRYDALKEDLTKNLTKAKEECLKAKHLACQYKFANLLSYSDKRLQYIDTRLSFEAQVQEESVPEDCFMGHKY